MAHRRNFDRPRNTNRDGGRARGDSPSENLLFGYHAIEAWLASRPDRVRVLRFDARSGERTRELVDQARAAGIATHPSDGDDLSQRCGGRRHQGVVAECSAFPYEEIETLIDARPPLLVAVDQLNDPHNLGAIVRSAEAAGAGGLLMPRDNCVAVTATAEVASAGGTAWLPICRVTNLVRSLSDLKEAGYWVAGLSARASQTIYDFAPPEQVVLLVGGEDGVRPLVERQIDYPLAIPMQGHAESLNASVAAAVALFELGRKRIVTSR